MDWLQAIAWIATVFGVLVTAWKFKSELRLTREQRALELRWRQAEAGKSLNDEMLKSPLAWSALQMLDYSGREFSLSKSERVRIESSDLRRALDPARLSEDEKDMYIRQCFDALFYFMSLLDHYANNTLILRQDVAFPLDYYIPRLAKLRPVVDQYLTWFKLDRTEAFLSRYPDWNVTPVAERTLPRNQS